MEEKKDNEKTEIYSQRVRAGKRTYFFDVKSTRSNDYYLTITESKRRYKEDGYFYEKHKIFLYKEDFNKFIEALNSTLDHVKTELMPEVDFSQFDKKDEEEGSAPPAPAPPAASAPATEEAPESKEETPSDNEMAESSEEKKSGIDSELSWE